ncbi:MAG: hypothetical protein ABJM18_06945, partial [Hyphomonas sp.]|uniref:hypothetical protein n=1 Tax=Hyphomonas sp. TaxID=87 RepID=UPI00329978A7
TIGLTLNELIDGGQIRVRPPDDRPDKTDARRRLVEPTEKFMGMYIESLLRTHDAITGTGG